MFRLVAAQIVASMVVAAGAWLIGGPHAALSSLLGALACALPNGLFALNLAQFRRVFAVAPAGARDHGAAQAALQADAGSRASGRATAFALLLLAGEFLKLALTIGLLCLIAWAYKDVVWLALIVAVIAVLMMQAAALVWV
jgi:ATP synthase protein I